MPRLGRPAIPKRFVCPLGSLVTRLLLDLRYPKLIHRDTVYFDPRKAVNIDPTFLQNCDATVSIHNCTIRVSCEFRFMVSRFEGVNDFLG